MKAFYNGAALAMQENVAKAETSDRAMQSGTSFPIGHLALIQTLGCSKTIGFLDHLQTEQRADSCRAARWQRRRPG